MTNLTLSDVRELAPAAFSTIAHPRTSTRYSLFRTGDIVESLLDQGWEITRAGQSRIATKTGRQLTDFSRHIVALSQPGLTYKDERIETLLINSNDGRTAFHAELGVYRFVCANGMIDATANLADANIRHFGYTQEQVSGFAQKVVERAPEVLNVIDAWKAKNLNADEQEALAAFALSARYGEDVPPIEAHELLLVRRDQDYGRDLWHTFNRVQENVLRGGQSYQRPGSRRNQTSRPIRSIATNVRLNKALWNAASALYDGQDLALPA
jgi:hypothetical protein